MSIINLNSQLANVYIVLGIDAHEHDQVVAVCYTYEDAKQYCIECLSETEFYDLWIEKHFLR